MEKKPNVFPSNKMTDAMKEANEIGTKIAEQANKENGVTGIIHKTQGELNADAEMKRKTIESLEEQLRLREEFLANKNNKEVPKSNPIDVSYPTSEVNIDKETIDDEKYYNLSQPQQNVPYDVIKLPSEGKIYKNGKSTLKLAYLNATDENIITNPNLLQSGKFLEILINRKMLDTDLRYKDLHVGDRNAIMIWLRSTGYGPMYNIILSDPKSSTYEEFTTTVDLSKLKMKFLGAEPDNNGLFDLKLDVSGSNIKFRLLNVGDVDDIEAHTKKLVDELGPEFTDVSTYTLKKQIVEVDGISESEHLDNFIKTMRIGDVRQLRKYIEKIESGVDMNITVGAPGGGSLNTFLPLNLTFFWPDI